MIILDNVNADHQKDAYYVLTLSISVAFRTQLVLFFGKKLLHPTKRVYGATEELIPNGFHEPLMQHANHA